MYFRKNEAFQSSLVKFNLKDPLTSKINMKRVTLLPLNYTRYEIIVLYKLSIHR